MNCIVCGLVGKGERMGMHKACVETYVLELQVLEAKQMLGELEDLDTEEEKPVCTSQPPMMAEMWEW